MSKHEDNDRWKLLSNLEKFRLNPSFIIGGTGVEVLKRHVYANDAFVLDDVPTCEGLLKVVFELVENACDNLAPESKHKPGKPTTSISVQISGNKVVVKNDGRSVLVDKKSISDGREMWIPTMIFSEFNSGTNFHDERTGAGMNGWGAKAAAAVSKKFKIKCCDVATGRTFSQTFENSLEKIGKPSIGEYTKEVKWTTTIEMEPDLSRFFPDVESLESMIPQVEARLIKMAAYFGKKASILFQNKKIKIQSLPK